MLFIINEKGEMVVANDWQDVPEPIVKMGYKINDKKVIILEGFDKYIRLNDYACKLNLGKTVVDKVTLMGQAFNKVAIVSFDLKTGEMKQETKMLGFEYNEKPINPELWKNGLSGIPKIYIETT